MSNGNMKEVKHYKVKSLPSYAVPDAIFYVKSDIDTKITTYITDLNGIPYLLKDDTAIGIKTLVNLDGTISVIGTTDVEIKIESTLLTSINSALQSGDNISSLTNDVGYLQNTDLPNTKAEYDSQLTDGNFLYVGDILSYNDEMSQDAVGNILLDTSTIDFNYDDLTPNISASVKPNSITATELSNSINISEFTNDSGFETTSQLNSRDINNRDRVNHTGSQAISSVSGLQTSLDNKVDKNVPVVGTTNTKISYDSKGLVIGSSSATTADISDSINKRYVTDADTIDIGNLSGINSGDQTSIVGITGTKSQFNTSVTDGDILYVGDITQYTDELSQDAIGNILTDTDTIHFSYNDGLNVISADVKANSITANQLADNINISEFTNNESYITLADIPAFNPSGYDLEDFTNTSVDPFIRNSELTSGATNLSYTPSSTGGTVNSDTGTDANLTLVDFTNAGLLTPEEKKLLYNNSSTGVTKFGGLTINVDTTKFNVGLVEGWFVNNHANTNIPTKVFKSFPPTTANSVPGIAIQNASYLGIDINGTLQFSATPFNQASQRDVCVLGVLVHSNRVVINAINNQPVVAIDNGAQLSDLIEGIGFFNISGNVFSANGANLSINKSLGSVFKQGSNFINSNKNPHTLTLPALIAPSNIRYRTQSGVETGNTSVISPNFWDDAGVVTAMTGTRWSIQRICVFQSNLVRIQYGQATYGNLSEAVQATSTEAFIIEQNILENGLFRGLLIVRRNATDLTDASRALFIEASKFGSDSGLGGLSVTNLQQAYNNSIAPEITTNTTLGALTIKRGSTLDTDTVLETQNGTGTITASIDGNGQILGSNLSGINTGDETLSSITTKLNIHSGSLDIDFGVSGDFLISTISATWVTALHYGKIKCEVFDDGVDHLFGEASLGNLAANIGNIVPGVSFDIVVTSQHDTWGRYIVKYNEII